MLYDYELPSWQNWVGSLAWAVVALALGTVIFRKFSARLVEEL